MEIWFLLVCPDFKAIGGRFLVNFDPPPIYVYNMGTNIKEARPNDLSAIDPARLTLWRTKGNMIINNSTTSKRLEDTLKRLRVTKNTIEELCSGLLVAELGLSHGETLLVRLLDNPKSGNNTVNDPVDDEASLDVVSELKEFKRYDNTLLVGINGVAPSEGARSQEYRRIQATDDEAIYDGRTAPWGMVSTIGPPIQIYHPIFDDFIHSINNPDVQPTIDDLNEVQNLMRFAANVGRREDEYSEELRRHLRIILGAAVHEEPNFDKTNSDGVIAIQIADARIAYLILELKRDVGEGGCDATTQVALSMRRSWTQHTRKVIREKCCCPTFLVAGGGPWLSVLGGVFTDKFIVQRLTDLKWMAVSSTEEDTRIYHNARVFVALRNCLANLRIFYATLNIPPLVANQPHPRYFPHPTSFVTEDGSITRFRYLRSLEPDAACVTYLAEIIDETRMSRATEDPRKVVVKFVARYGEEVHKFLAHKGWAPTLRYCGPLPGTKLYGVISGPTQKAPPGLCLRPDLMHMVVMDYIHAQPNTPPDVRGQIRSVLSLLHSEGYVFGDLRKQNILFDNGKVKLIDFNWCGRYDMNIRDENIPDDLQNKIDEKKAHVQENKNYTYYPLSMSTLRGMWASGMKPLAPIRPEHDWMMLEKLSW